MGEIDLDLRNVADVSKIEEYLFCGDCIRDDEANQAISVNLLPLVEL